MLSNIDIGRISSRRDELYGYRDFEIRTGMSDARDKVELNVNCMPLSFREHKLKVELEYMLNKVGVFEMYWKRNDLNYILALEEYSDALNRKKYFNDLPGLLRKKLLVDYRGSHDWREVKNFRDYIFRSFERRFNVEFSEEAIKYLYSYVEKKACVKLNKPMKLEKELDKYRITNLTNLSRFMEYCILSERRDSYGKTKVLCNT